MASHLRRLVGLCGLTILIACSPRPSSSSSVPDAGQQTHEIPTIKDPSPSGAAAGPVASMGVPFDPNDDFYKGPKSLLPDGKPRIIAVPAKKDTIDVAWLDKKSSQIVLSHIVPRSSGYEIAWHLKLETLDQLAGFARDEDGNRYWVTTHDEYDLQYQTEPTGIHRDGIARLIKMAPGGEHLFAVDLRDDIQSQTALPLVAPMAYGTGRLAVGGGAVAITFSALTEYDSNVSSRHQYQAYYLFDSATGAPRRYFGSASHSFEQRVVWDGERFVGVCHGDASLRGICMTAITPQGDSTTRVAFAIKGGDSSTGGAYQNTFTRLGAVVPGELGYALVFSTEATATYTEGVVNAPRDLAFIHIRPDFDTTPQPWKYDVTIADTADHNFRATGLEVPINDYFGSSYTGRNHGIVWLTHFADTSHNVESPTLVRLPDGVFIVLWEEWALGGPTGTWGMVIDEFGNVKVEATRLGDMRLYRGDDAFALGDRAAWVVGDSKVPELVLYTVDKTLSLRRYDLP